MENFWEFINYRDLLQRRGFRIYIPHPNEMVVTPF